MWIVFEPRLNQPPVPNLETVAFSAICSAIGIAVIGIPAARMLSRRRIQPSLKLTLLLLLGTLVGAAVGWLLMLAMLFDATPLFDVIIVAGIAGGSAGLLTALIWWGFNPDYLRGRV